MRQWTQEQRAPWPARFTAGSRRRSRQGQGRLKARPRLAETDGRTASVRRSERRCGTSPIGRFLTQGKPYRAMCEFLIPLRPATGELILGLSVSHGAVLPCRASSAEWAGAPICCKLDADHGATNEIQGYLYRGGASSRKPHLGNWIGLREAARLGFSARHKCGPS